MCIWNFIMSNLNLNTVTVSVPTTQGRSMGFFSCHVFLTGLSGVEHTASGIHTYSGAGKARFRPESRRDVTYVIHEWQMVPGCRSSAAWQGRAQTQRTHEAHSRHCINAVWNAGRGCWQNPTVPESTSRTRIWYIGSLMDIPLEG